MIRRLAIACMLAALALLLQGCDDNAATKEELRALFANSDTCCNTSDGVGIVDLYTQSTFEYYDRLLPVMLDGTRDEVKNLPPGYQYEVVLARLKSTRAEIQALDGRRYLATATSKGWYVIPTEYRTDDTLGDFQFLGEDEAWASIYTEGEDTGLSLCFRREEGVWKIDEPRSLDASLRAWQDEASREGKTLQDYIEFLASWDQAEDVPDTIWDPMPR